jgi:hypothetical protein
MFRLATGPLSIGKVLDAGIRLFAAGFTKVIGLSIVSAFAAAPLGVASAFMEDPTKPPSAQFFIWFFVGLLVTMLVSITIYNTIVHRLWGVANNNDKGLSPSIERGLATLLPTLGSAILYGLAVTGGMLLLIIPGIMFSISMMFFIIAIVVDRAGPVEALGVSRKLVKGNWWRTATIISVPLFVLIGFFVIVGLAIGVFAGLGGNAGAFQGLQANIVMQVVQSLFNSVTTPFFTAIYLVQYHDLKLRKQGADLSARVDALAASR